MIQTVAIRYPGYSNQLICVKLLDLAVIVLEDRSVLVANRGDGKDILGESWNEQNSACNNRFPVSLDNAIASSFCVNEVGGTSSIYL